MASSLSAADCKKFLKAHPDAAETSPLIKALEEYGRAEGKDDVDVLIEAIGQVVARAEAAKKKNAKNKELAHYLDDVIDDAEKEEDKASRRAEKQAESAEDESDEGGLLRAQLNRAKKLDAEDARPFVLALGQVSGLVIGKRPPVTKDQKNRARKMRTGKGKLFIGRCYGEKGTWVFELEGKPPGGLTKHIKSAAKLHAGIEIRLKLRGGGGEIDDENDLAELTEFGAEDEDEDEDEDEAEETAGATTSTPPFAQQARAVKVVLDRLKGVDAGAAGPLMSRYASALGHAQAGRQSQALDVLRDVEIQANRALNQPATTRGDGDEAAGDDEQSAKRASWRGDALSVGKLLNAALAQGRADAADLKAMFARASALAKPGGDIDQAAEALADLAAALEMGAPATETRGDAPAEAVKGPSLVVLQQARLVWDSARKKTIADVGKLSKAITAFCKTPEDAAVGATAVKNLEAILENLDEALCDTLDEALNAEAPEFRARKHREATAHIARYQAFIAQNPVIHTMDENPIAPVSIHATMSKALSLLASKLKV